MLSEIMGKFTGPALYLFSFPHDSLSLFPSPHPNLLSSFAGNICVHDISQPLYISELIGIGLACDWYFICMQAFILHYARTHTLGPWPSWARA